MRKVSVVFIFISAVVLFTLYVSGKISLAQVKPPDAEAESCVTSQCHAGIDKQKFVHGPVAAGKCKVCHGDSPGHNENPAAFKFKTILDISNICFGCHKRFPVKKFTHYPMLTDGCTDCHSPHGSPYKFQLLYKGGDLCFQCHDEALVAGKFVHGPAAVGGCVACHDPHTADYAMNLKAEGPDLCFMCHTDKAESIRQSQFVHKPVAEKCTRCHNPHSASKQFMLASTAPALCYSCHPDKKEQISAEAVRHGALDTERSCLNCHDPHNSNIARILLGNSMDVCISCHDREYKLPDGTVLMNMKKWLADNKDQHGPIRQKDCSGCHNPHGSENFRILRKPYPPTFYEPFSVENYALCFSCHDKTIVLDPETEKLTNFRNGNDNLHFRHVNKPLKGRTCRACHETHASNFPKHIRTSVTFGEWELPLNYQRTETGGSCAPGCHKLKKYDRVNKEINQ
ncbi:MAG: cytochrome C [Nitrospirae bacterium]|nr:cytochrome C [Nitrospirota bacterium]